MRIENFSSEGFSFINYTDCTPDLHRQILQTRNSEEIRKWMVDTSFISDENHKKFVESLKNRTDKLYFAVIFDNQLVATLNISKETNDVWERGIFSSPDIIGKGKTATVEKIFNKHLKQSGINCLTAKVKKDNPRSIRYHEKIGYKKDYSDNDFIYYKLDL